MSSCSDTYVVSFWNRENKTGQRRKTPFVSIDKAVEDEVNLEIPTVDKIFDVFDLSLPYYSEEHVEDVLQGPLNNFQKSLREATQAAERFQDLCDAQRKKLEN